MKKNTWAWIVIAVFLTIFGALTIAEADDASILRRFGQVMREQTKRSDDTRVIATYHDIEFTERDVNLRLEGNQLIGGESAKITTQKDAIEQLALGQMLLEEAERLGQTAKQEEIKHYLETSKNVWKSDEEVQQNLDDYCAGAGITIEDYWAEIENNAPVMLTKWKLSNYVMETYLAEHPDADQTMQNEYWETYKAQLLEQHRGEIIYQQ